MNQEQRWDEAAASFDEDADHGLLDPAVRAAWSAMLVPLLPETPADVVDLGCGTGSLSVLLAEVGYSVLGLALSGRMIDLARRKASAAGLPVAFLQGDAADPPYPGGSCDVVLVRHVLWAMPDPAAALEKWIAMSRPAGRLVLVEGRWSTGAGLTSDECRSLVLRHRSNAEVSVLDDPALWGGPLTDERCVVVSRG